MFVVAGTYQRNIPDHNGIAHLAPGLPGGYGPHGHGDNSRCARWRMGIVRHFRNQRFGVVRYHQRCLLRTVTPGEPGAK